MLKVRVLHPEQIVARKEVHADCMYFIASGALEFELEQDPAILHPWDFFGKTTLIEKSECVANIVAPELIRFQVLDAQDLARFPNSNSELHQIVTRVAVECQTAHDVNRCCS